MADAFPAAYQEDFPADRAVADLEVLDGLAAGELSLRLWVPAGAAPGERRLTIYRAGERLLLSDVLPLLQHMGVSVVDERPYEIDRIGSRLSWIYDFGVAVPAGSATGSCRCCARFPSGSPTPWTPSGAATPRTTASGRWCCWPG
ncbi:NAD-glutamate dehydrogenase domain-containing protein [Blastococcus sp. TML/M2B]|uniref:NAD-glutamate dehydrogenase domain-containing protein n=1 Tax=Blastococcus sp. TML/M2B TaxID=2798727 RepID=UPI001F5B83C1|nr:NAD-glutamate dehydrogenase domain-containing protein [Blastococcus sp. TML/M2B]